MKKILSLVFGIALMASNVLPVTLLNLSVPVASAAACTIGTDTTVDQSYIDTNSCQTINVDTSSVITFSGNLDLDSAGTFTVDESVTATLSGTGIFTDSNDSIVINGTLTHADENVTGVAISASGNFSVGATGSINVDEKGCTGAPNNSTNGEGPNLNTLACATGASGFGDTLGAGASHGGLGGIDSYDDGGTGTMYGDSANPIYLGSGGGGANDSSDGGDGGGLVYLNIEGILDTDGTITADGGDGDSPAYGGGGGSGGSVLIHAGTLSGDGSIGANGGAGGDGSGHDGGGGGGGRVAVYYDTLSGFDLSGIEAGKGLRGGNSGGNDAEDGLNGSTFILDRKTDDGAGNLRITSGLDFQDGGDYSRNTLTIAEDAMLQCADDITTLTIYADSGNVNFPNWYCRSTITTMNFIAAGGNIAMTGTSIVFGGGSIGTFNLTASNTLSASSIDWSDLQSTHINITADTWSDTGNNTMAFDKSSQHVLWEITNDLVLENLTYNTIGGNRNGSGSVFEINNAINVDLINTDINSSVNWTNLSSLDIDSDSTINANHTGCAGGWEGNGNDDGTGPNTTTGVCAIRTSGYGYADGGGGGGAGHGGAGGRGYHDEPGAAYDIEAAPVLLGSGGGAGNPGPPGGAGGGKIWIQVAGVLTVAGSITADGEDGIDAGMGTGGGSGGSVYLNVGTLAGAGSVSANAGDGGTDTSYAGGGGGGGRIAILYGTDSSTFLGSMSAANSTTGGADGGPGNAEAGSNGTLYLLNQVVLDSVKITDNEDSGYTPDSAPVITLATSGATATGVAYSCDNSNWTGFSAYPDDDVVNDGDGPSFDITTGFTGCTTTEEEKTIYIKVSGGGNESSVVSDTTTYDISAPSVSSVSASNSNGTLNAGETVAVQITFDEVMLVDTSGGTPTVELDMDSTDRDATYNTGSGSTILDFTYTIVSGDNKTDLAYTGSSALFAASDVLTDRAGNNANLALAVPGEANSLSANKDINVSTNQDPTAASVTAVQVPSGDSEVTIEFTIDDPDDDDTLSAKVEYNVGSGWNKATLFDGEEDISATYGTPAVDNDEPYQVGTAAGYITSSSGANTITVIWDSASDEIDADTSSAQIRVTPYDSIAAGTAATSSLFAMDQVSPTGLTTISSSNVESTTMTLGWTAAADTNFTNYKVYYKKSTDSSYALHSTITSTSTTSVNFTGLTSNTTYSFYTVATDDYGNTTTSPTLSQLLSADDPGWQEVTGGGGGGGSSSSSSSSSSDSSSDSTESDSSTSDTTEDADSGELAGEAEDGDDDFDTGITIEEPEETIVEEESEEIVVAEPTPVPIVAPVVEETTEEPTEEASISTFVSTEITQEIYEDEVVVTFHDSDDSELKSIVIPSDSSDRISIDLSQILPISFTIIDDKFADEPSSYVDEPVEYEEAVEEIVEEVESLSDSIVDLETDVADIIEDALEDKDEDGILDIWEEENFGDTDTDGTADTDGDGLTDAEEAAVGSDPFEADSDNDGISDLVEASIGTDPQSWDSDGDGVSDTDELIEDTDPTERDTVYIDPITYDEDTDGDGMSDYMEEYYGTDPEDDDSDNDGISDSDEIAYDLDPNSADYIEDLDTAVTNISAGAVSNSSDVTVKGTSEPNTTVVVYVFGGGAGSSPVAILETTTDDAGKFATAVTDQLDDGEYSIFLASADEKDNIKGISTLTKFTVDTEQEAPQVEVKEFAGTTSFGLGSKVMTDNPRPKMRAVSTPGSIIHISWKSLIFTSVVVADSQTGEFEVQPPQDLGAEDHVAYIYAEDPETGITGKTTQVNFTVATDVLLHESAAQREAADRFPYGYLLLAALIAAGGAFIFLKRGRSAEAKMIDKLK